MKVTQSCLLMKVALPLMSLVIMATTEKEQRCMGVKNWQAKGRVNAIGTLLFK